MSEIEVLPATPEGLERAAELLARGELVVFPTDTVHGVACRRNDPDALERLFALKGRPLDKRIPWLLSDLQQARDLDLLVDERAERAAERWWPGPLTLVLRVGESGDPELGETLGVRAPAHETARGLLERTGPLPTTSANPSGLPETWSTDDVLVAFAGSPLLAAIVDGHSERGRPSSVIDLSDPGAARLLREGAVGRAELEAVIGPID